MNIDAVSGISYKANSQNVKKMMIPLKDKSSLYLSVSDNSITSITKKGNKTVSSNVVGNLRGITSKELWRTFEKIQKNVKDGFDFYQEFRNSILKDMRKSSKVKF